MKHPNVALLFILLISLFTISCAGKSAYMKPSDSLLNPSYDKAVVRFMRPSGYGYAKNFNIMDGEKVIGNSVAESQFDYRADPGQHLFMATAENKAFLEANLEAGKTYYIITQVKMGAWAVRVGLIPVNRGSEFWDKVLEYENVLNKLEPEQELLEQWEDANKAKIQNVLQGYETKWKHEHAWGTLSPEDGR